MARRSSSRTVYLAAQVRDTLQLWQIDRDGARTIPVDRLPSGSVVLRASERDMRLSLAGRTSPATAALTELGEPCAVLVGVGRTVYATPLPDVWVYRERGIRAAPAGALLDALVRRERLTMPAVLGIHLGSSGSSGSPEESLLVLWAWGRDGSMSAPLVVTQPLAGEAFAGRLAGYAAEHGIDEQHIAILEAEDVLALGQRLRAYPLSEEWGGVPVLAWGVAALVLALGLWTLALAGRLWVEVRNDDLAGAIARERDRSALTAERSAFARAHAESYARLGSAVPGIAWAAADALRQPGTEQVLAQSGASTQITVSAALTGTEVTFYRERLARLIGTPAPAGFDRLDPRIGDGGARVEVEYVRAH